jgi:hypothetical protein
LVRKSGVIFYFSTIFQVFFLYLTLKQIHRET